MNDVFFVSGVAPPLEHYDADTEAVVAQDGADDEDGGGRTMRKNSTIVRKRRRKSSSLKQVRNWPSSNNIRLVSDFSTKKAVVDTNLAYTLRSICMGEYIDTYLAEFT